MRILLAPVAIALVALSMPAWAVQSRNPSVEARGVVRPAPDSFDYYRRMRDGAFAAWASDEDERYVSHSYRMALQFAECVAHFNRDTAGKVLVASIAGREDGVNLRRMAEVNPGCATEHRKVHPLLLRAALAETLVEGKSVLPSAEGPAGKSSVGVPKMVDGYPLGAISRCQVQVAPKMVADLFATVPGERAERDAAEALFGKTPACGTTKLGRLTPTAARLALIDAAYSASLKVAARR